MTNIERFRAITKEMAETYEKKNHDYGDSFGRSLDKRGLMAALVRMEDKMNRLDSLAEKDAQVNESLADTLTDLANYAIMTRMWLEGKESIFEEPCEKSQGTIADEFYRAERMSFLIDGKEPQSACFRCDKFQACVSDHKSH